MKNKYTTIALVVLIALALGLYYYLKDSNNDLLVENGNANATSTATTTGSTSGTKTGTGVITATGNNRTYTDQKHNFTINYPSTAKLDASIVQFHDLGNKWRVLAENNNGEAILTVKVFRVDQGGVVTGKPYPLFYTSEVRIGASDNVTECYKTDAGYTSQKVTDVVINNTAFKKFEFGDAAMMKYVNGVSYRTIHNNKCYAIEQVRNGSLYKDNTMTAGLSQSTLDTYYKQAMDVALSFKFTK